MVKYHRREHKRYENCVECCFLLEKYHYYLHIELDQEEEDRKKQELEASRALDDGGFDDPIEPEDPTEVNISMVSQGSHKLIVI